MAENLPNVFSPSAPVLVTGGRGFIGTHLVQFLLDAGLHVVSVDIQPGWRPSDPQVIEVDTDVRDTTKMEALFAQYKFSTVFDLASFTEVGLSEREYQRNVDATKSMVALANKFDVRKYIFYSSQFVFRREGVLPLSETDYSPVEAYGASKVKSEILIRDGLDRDRWLILRPTYIWGPGLTRFRDGLLLRLAKHQFLVPSDPGLTRYYGYVETIVKQTCEFANADFKKLERKVYYISDDAIPLSDFCTFFVKALGRGGALDVPAKFIRLLGFLGGLTSRCGLQAPINPVQARELTRRFPVPIGPTLVATKATTDLGRAAQETVAWALSDPAFSSRIGAA